MMSIVSKKFLLMRNQFGIRDWNVRQEKQIHSIFTFNGTTTELQTLKYETSNFTPIHFENQIFNKWIIFLQENTSPIQYGPYYMGAIIQTIIHHNYMFYVKYDRLDKIFNISYVLYKLNDIAYYLMLSDKNYN